MHKQGEKKLNKIDPKECNVPNVNFSLVGDNDKRGAQFKKQRLERGFDESETWSLDYTIACFIAPRLKEFIEIYKKVIVDDCGLVPKAERALKAFEKIAEGDTVWKEDEYNEITEALKGFAEIFLGLWW